VLENQKKETPKQMKPKNIFTHLMVTQRFTNKAKLGFLEFLGFLINFDSAANANQCFLVPTKKFNHLRQPIDDVLQTVEAPWKTHMLIHFARRSN